MLIYHIFIKGQFYGKTNTNSGKDGIREEKGEWLLKFFENPAIVFVNLCLFSFDPSRFFYCFILGPRKAYFPGFIPEFRDILCTAHRRAIVVSGWLHGFTLLTQQFSNE